MVLQFQYNSYEYASALLTLEKANHQEQLLAIAAGGKKTDLLTRVELIMGVNKKPGISFNKIAGLLAGLLCIIALNALLLLTRSNTGNQPLTLTHFSSPVSFGDYEESPVKEVAVTTPVTEKTTTPVVNHIQEKKSVEQANAEFAQYVSSYINPALIQASLERVQVPELKKYQEEQVKNAIEASKKVIENVQWKAVEKSIADAFNQDEKEQLKVTYEKQLEKLDWKKWENDLKLAYNKIDWEKINTQLSVAVNQVRLDSIQTVYNKAISKLDVASKELSLNDMDGIPDTDITLKEIERKKADVQRALNQLKLMRSKKIVHL